MVISIILGAGVIKSEHDRQGHGTLNWQCPNNEFMIGAIFCMMMLGSHLEN